MKKGGKILKKKVFVEFSCPLTKDEKKLINFLVKKELKLEKLTFLLEDLDIPKLKNSKLSFIDRFCKKGIYLYSNDDMEYLSIFNSYSFTNNFVTINFNPIFIEYLKDEEKIFHYNLPQILFFKYDFSIDFFYKLIKPNFLDSTIEIPLEEFRDIINNYKYKRLYDVKRFLIEPLIEDINLYTDFKLSYKINKTDTSYTIVFYLKNNNIDEVRNYVNNFLRLYKHYILEPEKLKVVIFNAIQTHGYNYTKNKLLLTIKNKKKYRLKFDDIFEKFLNNELGESYVALKKIECEVKSINKLKELVFKELAPLDIPEIAKLDYNTSLTQKIFWMKEKEITEIISDNLKIELFFNPENKSNINIYLRYIK